LRSGANEFSIAGSSEGDLVSYEAQSTLSEPFRRGSKEENTALGLHVASSIAKAQEQSFGELPRSDHNLCLHASPLGFFLLRTRPA